MCAWLKFTFVPSFVYVKYAAKRLLIDSNEDRVENEKISAIRIILLPLLFQSFTRNACISYLCCMNVSTVYEKHQNEPQVLSR